MKRLLVGIMLAGMLQMGLTSTAGAALVPPTEECSATFKTLFQGYVSKSMKGGLSDKEERRLDRQLTKDIASAGCISDAEPLLKDVPLKRYSSECVESAASAETLWAADSRKIKALSRTFQKKVEMPLFSRLSRIDEQVRRLKEQGGKTDQIRKLKLKREKLKAAFGRRIDAHYRRLEVIVGDTAYANLLVLYEFRSLRCVGVGFAGGNSAKDPVGRVLEKNWELLFVSFGRVTSSATQSAPAEAARLSFPVTG